MNVVEVTGETVSKLSHLVKKAGQILFISMICIK